MNNLHLGLQDLKLDDYEWANILSVATFLQKAHEVTVLQSSKTRVTLSLIPGMYTLLKNHCDAVKLGQMPDWTSNECKEAATCMLEKLQSYDDLINSNIVKMAKLLDPRFKSDTRLMPTLRTILIDNYEYGQLDSDARPQSNTQYESSVLDAVFDLDRDDTESCNASQIGLYDADEVTKYFQFTSIPDTSTDPLDWWKAAETRFPTIARMARDYLAVQSTSVACESTFSESGQLITSRRTCMSEESIEASMLCRNWIRSDISFA